MKVVAIIQARMGSTRLPGKSLLSLAGVPLIQHILERVQRATLLDGVVLAVPSRDAAAFAPTAKGRAWLYGYPGDEQDVVDRYRCAADTHQADVIVRIPGDNPCVDPVYIDKAIASYRNDPCVYYSNTTAAVGDVVVDGIGAEVLSYSRLQWLDQRTRGVPYLREHPHRYFEECGLLRLPRADLRLDVNTPADYAGMADLYTHFGHNRFTSAEVVAMLTAQTEAV